MDWLLGSPSRILSPPANHPTAYGKLVMGKDTKAKNTQRIFISGFPSFQIHYFSKGLILDKEELILYKEELILDMEEDILSLRLINFLSKNQEEIGEPLSINEEDPPQWEGKQFQLCEPSISSSPYFADLLIREAADPPSPDCPFL